VYNAGRMAGRQFPLMGGVQTNKLGARRFPGDGYGASLGE
jgi:hypothetical protein